MKYHMAAVSKSTGDHKGNFGKVQDDGTQYQNCLYMFLLIIDLGMVKACFFLYFLFANDDSALTRMKKSSWKHQYFETELQQPQDCNTLLHLNWDWPRIFFKISGKWGVISISIFFKIRTSSLFKRHRNAQWTKRQKTPSFFDNFHHIRSSLLIKCHAVNKN